MRCAAAGLAVLALALASAPRGASAQTNDRSTTAQALFEEGLALMTAGKLAEACPKLQKSQDLDPGIGTAYRLGECYEKMGRLASAWELFVGVAEGARKGGQTQKAEVAQRRADALRPRLAKIVIGLEPGAAAIPGLAVSRDGVELSKLLLGTGIPIDAGEHEIRATAPGKKPFATKVVVAVDATNVAVSIPALEDAPVAGASPTTEAPSSTGRGQRIAGVVLGITGLAGVGVGAAFGVVATSTWDKALGGCVDRDPTKCPASAQQKGQDASTQATISTVGFVAGGALAAAGVIVFLTAPSARSASGSAPRLRALLGADGGRLVVEGQL